MTENNDLGLRPIKRALISVSDKTGVIAFASALKSFGVEIISTGGTAKSLREAGIEVRDVSDVTGFPEMMDGRVKTLHPKIHGALLGLRDNKAHRAAMNEQGIEPIDLVVVNLYPFEQTIKLNDVTFDQAIEQIDIGGPAMIRSAAKNAQDVAVIVKADSYEPIAEELRRYDGKLTLATRRRLAAEAFRHTSNYDCVVSSYLEIISNPQGPAVTATTFGAAQIEGGKPMASEPSRDFWDIDSSQGSSSLPISAEWTINKKAELRYGENPHQIAALYDLSMGNQNGIANGELLGGKEMSFNNYVDADAAWQLVSDFDETACAIIKHTNPAGVGLAARPVDAYEKALATDPISAFGGIVAFNRAVDAPAAQALTKIFTEVVIAPDFAPDALEILGSKKNLRVMKIKSVNTMKQVEYRHISGGMLVQTKDDHKISRDELRTVTKRAPTEEEIRALLFAWTVCKHTKSNAIVYAREGQTVGVGAGQMSRVDSVKIGAMRAQLSLAGSVLASDAFFPFRDGIDEAAKHGITAVIQPGGSVRDDEVIAAANEHNLAMVFTGIRHFKH